MSHWASASHWCKHSTMVTLALSFNPLVAPTLPLALPSPWPWAELWLVEECERWADAGLTAAWSARNVRWWSPERVPVSDAARYWPIAAPPPDGHTRADQSREDKHKELRWEVKMTHDYRWNQRFLRGHSASMLGFSPSHLCQLSLALFKGFYGVLLQSIVLQHGAHIIHAAQSNGWGTELSYK